MAEIASGKWESAADTSGRVVRHTLADRLYHWLMAICVFVLMGTAFLPILGIKFAWLDIHWIAGVCLAALVLIHIVRALIWQDWRNMWIGLSDIRNIWRNLARMLGGRGPRPSLPGKYDHAQKLYHFGIAVVVLCVVCSGLLMLLKIDTPLWRRNPYILAQDSWGIIYVVHGFAAMTIVAAVIVHIYFNLRPEEWYLTRSMFRGWITRKEHAAHHDPERWTP
jgi:cytochrome b subunit of formate dehydrogenase